jgi:hypothetical protein
MLDSSMKELNRRHLSTGRTIGRMIEKMNQFDMLLTPREAELFLYRSANEYDIVHCEECDCSVCEDFCVIWKSVYDALPEDSKFRVDLRMEEAFLPHPVVYGRQD